MSTKIKSQQAPVLSQSDIKAANWARAKLWVIERKFWVSGVIVVLGMIGTRAKAENDRLRKVTPWAKHAAAQNKKKLEQGIDVEKIMHEPGFSKYTATLHPMPGTIGVDKFFKSEEEEDKFLEELYPDLYKLHKSRIGTKPKRADF